MGENNSDRKLAICDLVWYTTVGCCSSVVAFLAFKVALNAYNWLEEDDECE